jgi:cytoskeletal protein CcmA (bactofilin family)
LLAVVNSRHKILEVQVFNRGTNSDGRPPDLQNLFQSTPANPAAAPVPTGPLVPQSANIPTSSVAEAQASSLSIIGADLVILGDKITVITKARLLVDGEVRGDINGREVIIGQTGKVTGTVAANSIEVHGHVYGAVRAQSVTLHPTAHVDGDIHNQVLKISEGAVFDGRVRRAKDASELTPILDPAAFTPAKQG